MITVPYEVKKALRDGMLRKNYRVVVDFQEWREAGEVPTTRYTPSHYTTDEKFVITDGNKYKFVVDDANSTSYQLYYCFTNYTSFEELSPTEANTWVLDNIPNNYAEVIVKSNNNYNSTVKVQKYIDEFTIDNDTLVSESVNIDERMCSGDTLKFGLCEGSSLEFQYFDHPNITGKRVQVFVDVEYEILTDGWKKIADFESGENITITEAGNYRVLCTNGRYTTTILIDDGQMSYYTPVLFDDGYGYIFNRLSEGDELAIVWSAPFTPEANPCILQKQAKVKSRRWYSIPIGFFDVKKCSRQASTRIIKATAYNKLMSDYLDAKATDEVKALIDAGEYGYTDSISIYSLLKDLLLDYSVEKEQYSNVQQAFNFSSASTLVSIPLCDSSGVAISAKLHIGIYSIFMDLSAEDFYNFYLRTWAIYRQARDLWASYKNNYTKYNGRVYTLEDYAVLDIPEDSYARALCGAIGLRKASDINTFFFLYKCDMYNFRTSDYTNIYSIEVAVPVLTVMSTSAPTVDHTIWRQHFEEYWGNDFDFLQIYKRELTDIEKMRLTTQEFENIQDVTLRDLQSAVYEMNCQFGQLSRTTDLFSGVELNHSRLYPADTLYPATDLYPDGAAVSGFKSMYSKLWADEGNIHKWRNLIITYKGLNGDQQEEDFTLERQVNADGTDDYNMSDNWLFRNLVWTAEQVDEYATVMVAKMQDMTWFPFEMWCAGLPYLETGDEIEIPLNGESYTSYVLQRQLKGIQNLQDTYINGTLDIF